MSEEQMTIERAIQLLHPETTAAALAEIEYYHGFSGRTACVQAVSDACEFACEIMQDYKETKDALAGMEIMLTSATSAAETFEKRMNAAINDIPRTCSTCRYDDSAYQSNECFDCVRGSSWKWRGVPEEQEQRKEQSE